ncbi:MAG UNVERIFIED_CONTAM: (Fe-S)-binding protein [Planctomycetaceae bacterium]|jgi:glycolate oxidase iron-sulfur subunit
MTGTSPHRPLRELLTSCVHCGFCLEVCPTFQASGDENNSPRGRLRLWREESEGQLPPDPWTASYTSDCIGCLACEPACPANVPYGEILEQVRHEHVQSGRSAPRLMLRAAAWLAAAAETVQWCHAACSLASSLAFGEAPTAFSGQACSRAVDGSICTAVDGAAQAHGSPRSIAHRLPDGCCVPGD